MRNFTEDEQIIRLYDTEQIRAAMHRFCYYMGNAERERALAELWVHENDRQKTMSLGYNTGYFIGMDEVRRGFMHDLRTGDGEAAMYTLNTPLIKIAEDGATARMCGYCLGFDCSADSGEYLLFARIFADLVKENGRWRIWHMIIAHDHSMETGENYARTPVFGWEDPMYGRLAEPTEKRTVYEPTFGWEYMYEDMPRDHKTYRDFQGYGPEGQFGRTYYERERRLEESI